MPETQRDIYGEPEPKDPAVQDWLAAVNAAFQEKEVNCGAESEKTRRD